MSYSLVAENLKLNGNALFLRNFKGKVGKIRRGAPPKRGRVRKATFNTIPAGQSEEVRLYESIIL